MVPSPAEVARTLAAGVLPGYLHFLDGVPLRVRTRHATDAKGRPLLLVAEADRAARTLVPAPGCDDSAVTLCVPDVPPFAGSPSRGQLWVTGRAGPLAGAEQNAAALAFADINPLGDLLDLSRGFTLYRIDVAEVRLDHGDHTIEVDLDGYATAEPDPLHSQERELLADLLVHHPDALTALLRRIRQEIPTANWARPARLDRYGLTLTVDTAWRPQRGPARLPLRGERSARARPPAAPPAVLPPPIRRPTPRDRRPAMTTLDSIPQRDADRLLQAAHATGYRFPEDFGGFRAALRTHHGDVGTVAVTGRRDINVELPDGSADAAWVAEQITSIVSHRWATRYEDGDGRWAKRLEGDRIEVLDDPFDSAYRLRDGAIREVHRTVGDRRFTIVVADRVGAPDGRFVPSHFAVFYWRTDDHQLVRAEQYHDRYARVGDVLLPARREVTSASAEGLTTRWLELSDHTVNPVH